MRTEEIMFDPNNSAQDNILSYQYWETLGHSNTKEIRRMIKFIKNAMDKVLTPTQNTCVTMVYLQNMKQKEVAKELGLPTSVVSRHIKAGLKKLRDVSELYVPYEEDEENEIEELLRNI